MPACWQPALYASLRYLHVCADGLNLRMCLPFDYLGAWAGAGPGRKKLRVKEPEKYHWRPKELLASICSIYVHLNRADARGVFAAAIAADGRCYRPDMFPEAAQVCLMHMPCTVLLYVSRCSVCNWLILSACDYFWQMMHTLK